MATDKKQKKPIYLNNPNLPTIGAEFEYTPEMLAEMQLCSDNVLHFAENHFYIINLDEGRQKIKLHLYQKRALRMIRDNRFSLLLFSRQTGKCLKMNTLCKFRNKKTGEIREFTIKQLFDISAIEKIVWNLLKMETEKFIESHKVVDYEVWTDEGWVDIQEVHKTIKFDVWIVETENFKLECADEHIVIGENRQEIYVKDLKIGDKIITEKGLENVIKIEKLDIDPEHMYDLSIDSENHTFFSNGILSHNSTICTIFCLWTAIFTPDQRIILVANKESTAKEIFKRIRMAYENLPNWLKSPVTYYGMESMELANGSRIGITTTTGTAGRGSAANLLFIDEADWIEANLLDEFWASVYPIISSSKKSKIIMASTPRDTSGLFYKLYDGSVRLTNNWKAMKIKWDEVPGRDQKWMQETMSSIGDANVWRREFEVEFDEVGESALDTEAFETMKTLVVEPKYILEDDCYKIWHSPSDERSYVAGVDISEGLGRDSTCIQILDVTEPRNIVQVACYNNNKISPSEFTPKLFEILEQWGRPFVLIERNNCGGQVVDNLKRIYDYENIVSWGKKEAERKNMQLGVISHTNTKYKCIQNMRHWMLKTKSVIINDINTVLELKDFIRYKNGTWAAKANSHDDRVMSLGWALMILSEEIVERYFEILEKDEFQKPMVIKELDLGVKYLVRPDYENLNALPVYLGMHKETDPSLDELTSSGWKFLT